MSIKHQRNCSYVAQDPVARCVLRDAAHRCRETCTTCDSSDVVVTTYEGFRDDVKVESRAGNQVPSRCIFFMRSVERACS